MATCLISLGSNVGDRVGMLRNSLELLNAQPAIEVLNCSHWYVSQAVGGPTRQDDYFNGVATLQVSQDPLGVLHALQQVESELGRRREVRWGPRLIDLDLLLYDDQILLTDELALPHPRMCFRRFVALPAAQVAPEMIHPQIGWNLARLRDHLTGAIPYVALAGATPQDRHQLAAEVATRVSLNWIQDPGDDLDEFFGCAEQGTAVVPTPQARLEFLEQCVETINESISKQPSVVTLSDYWLPELGNQLGLAGDSTERPDRPQPKLLVALWNPATKTDSPQRMEQLVQAFHDGPHLLLRWDETAADEVAAAIEAMQADVSQLT